MAGKKRKSPSLFPPLSKASKEGLLAYGFEINTSLLLNAYQNGIFPWYNEDDPVLWWSPPIRSVLNPSDFSPSKSLQQLAKNRGYEITINQSFEQVMRACAHAKRKDTHKTWIHEEMIEAYCELFHSGNAISVETRCKHELVGGLYGVLIGKAFIGESMFSDMRDASKFALWQFCNHCQKEGILFIDGQLPSPHLASLGFKEIPRREYIKMLKHAVENAYNQTPA
jgi:leucyl/phenylalanyl-tRNA--protein transferase